MADETDVLVKYVLVPSGTGSLQFASKVHSLTENITLPNVTLNNGYIVSGYELNGVSITDSKLLSSNAGQNLNQQTGEILVIIYNSPLPRKFLDYNGLTYFMGAIGTSFNGAIQSLHDSFAPAIADLKSRVSSLETSIVSQTVEVTLLAANWQGTSVPYTYALSVTGVTTSTNQDITYRPTATKAQIEACQEANIIQGTQGDNVINLRAFGTKPTIDIPIVVVKRGIK